MLRGWPNEETEKQERHLVHFHDFHIGNQKEKGCSKKELQTTRKVELMNAKPQTQLS